jgi:hypothetical protein
VDWLFLLMCTRRYLDTITTSGTQGVAPDPVHLGSIVCKLGLIGFHIDIVTSASLIPCMWLPVDYKWWVEHPGTVR